MEDLVAARATLRSAPDDEEKEATLLRAGVRVMRRFYTAFFAEVYDANVDGFGWDPKRQAVEAIVRRQDEDAAAEARDEDDEDEEDEDDLADMREGVASLFEDLSDVLHGEVDFGYTDDIEILREFAGEYLDVWWDAVGDWLEAAGAPDAALLKEQYEGQGNP